MDESFGYFDCLGEAASFEIIDLRFERDNLTIGPQFTGVFSPAKILCNAILSVLALYVY